MNNAWVHINWQVGRADASTIGAWLGTTMGALIGAGVGMVVLGLVLRGDYWGPRDGRWKLDALTGAEWGARFGFLIGVGAGLLSGRIYPTRIGLAALTMCVALGAMFMLGIGGILRPDAAVGTACILALVLILFAAGARW